MSGDGVVSVRLPLSLLGTFRVAAEDKHLTIHEAAQSLVAALSTLTGDELMGLAEPPRELETPRISLYLGWRLIDALVVATRNSELTNSAIFRRLLHALLVSEEIRFVQQNEHWKLQIERQIK